MGFEISKVTVKQYDKQGMSKGGIGMGSSKPDGKIDNIEFRSALTNALSEELSSLSFDKKIELINLINQYSIKDTIDNDQEFQNQLKTALTHLSQKTNRKNSWQEPQFRNGNTFWSQFKPY